MRNRYQSIETWLHRNSMKLVTLFVIWLLYKNNLCEMKIRSIDEELATKFQFQMFENFDGCKELYIQERKLVKKLMEVKQKLLEAQINFRGILKAGTKIDRTKGDMLPDLRRKISSPLNNLIEFSEVKTQKYPTESDMMG